MVLELSLPDQSGFQTLVELVPLASRPQIAVIVLTVMSHPGVWRLAKENGAYACLGKEFTSGEDLDKAIQRAIAFVGQMPKEDRYRWQPPPKQFSPKNPTRDNPLDEPSPGGGR